MKLRNIIRRLYSREWSSAEEFWGKRTFFGQINETLGFRFIAFDRYRYNLPLISNPFAFRQHTNICKDDTQLFHEFSLSGGDKRAWAERRFEFLVSFLRGRISKEESIFEVGCNSGFMLEKFHELGYRRLYGVDPQCSAVTWANENRPYLSIKEGIFGPRENDVECDILMAFDCIFKVPYRQKVFNAIDRCARKYVLLSMFGDVAHDHYRDPHYNLGKRGFACIEKITVTDVRGANPADLFKPIGVPGADGPMIEWANEEDSGLPPGTNFRTFMLFRRLDPRKSKN